MTGPRPQKAGAKDSMLCKPRGLVSQAVCLQICPQPKEGVRTVDSDIRGLGQLVAPAVWEGHVEEGQQRMSSGLGSEPVPTRRASLTEDQGGPGPGDAAAAWTVPLQLQTPDTPPTNSHLQCFTYSERLTFTQKGDKANNTETLGDSAL